MGGTTFMTEALGKTAEAAFRAARDEAKWEHGHGGYTGTVAEKHSFVMLDMTSKDARAYLDYAIKKASDSREESYLKGVKKRLKGRLDPYQVAQLLIDVGHPTIRDKWGPAGCIDLDPRLTGKRKPKRFLFFGWASC
jgi:hypothetical protein